MSTKVEVLILPTWMMSETLAPAKVEFVIITGRVYSILLQIGGNLAIFWLQRKINPSFIGSFGSITKVCIPVI